MLYRKRTRMLTSSNHVLLNGAVKNPWQTGKFRGLKFKTWYCCRFGEQKLPCCSKNKFHLSGGKNHESGRGVDDELFIHSDICSHCILTFFYIFSINVLKLILNLASPGFAKDLKELFVCQSNCIFWKGLNHCDWRAMLQPVHFHHSYGFVTLNSLLIVIFWS